MKHRGTMFLDMTEIRLDGRPRLICWLDQEKEALCYKDNEGYFRGKIDNKTYLAHRAAWYLHYGEWPNSIIDHIDGDKENNRISNLRLASATESAFNRRGRKNSSSVHKGVCWDNQKSKWRTRVQANGVVFNLGLFDDEVEAAKAVDIKIKEVHGEFAKTNF